MGDGLGCWLPCFFLQGRACLEVGSIEDKEQREKNVGPASKDIDCFYVGSRRS